LIKKIIEKIEGEAKLNFSFDNEKKIDFVKIEFFNTRNIEKILEEKNALDALVINPRVCGICGHAHLIATVKALEDCYNDIQVTQKAEILRELTLNFEIIQNHIKWFYLTILPLLGYKNYTLKALSSSKIISKAIAVIAGQYPHNSYAIVGGVVCEPTPMDIVKVKNYILEILDFFKKNIIIQKTSHQTFDDINLNMIMKSDGDLPMLLNTLIDKELTHVGKSFDRFIVFGENNIFKKGKAIHTNIYTNINPLQIEEVSISKNLAKNALYKDKYYEVGSISRMMIKKNLLIKDLHRKYSDSIFTRITSRVCEILELLEHNIKLIDQIDLTQKSYIQPKVEISKISGFGISCIEAARGSLVHKVSLENGIIKKYDIITPTQWNLANGTKEKPSASQQAMIGLSDTSIAELVFKSFDVCSVCTTH